MFHLLRNLCSGPKPLADLPPQQLQLSRPAVYMPHSLKEFTSHWKMWQKSAFPGDGEMREVAVHRLLDCLKRKDDCLDLRSLNLSTLPLMPEHVRTLLASNNKLIGLPSLPPQLETLMVDCNQLPALPTELPASLRHINLSVNQLTDLPEDIYHLPAYLDVSDNPLSDAAIHRLKQATEDSSNEGAHIRFSSRETYINERAALADSVRRWYPQSQQPAVGDTWYGFRHETYAPQFNAFLTRLMACVTSANASVVRVRVAAWLNRLADDPDLREQIFAMTREPARNPGLTWLHMQQTVLLHDINNGDYDDRLADLIKAGRKIFRQEQLEQLAHQKAQQLRGLQYPDNDDIGLTADSVVNARAISRAEILSVYLTSLRGPLKLPPETTIHSPRLSTLSKTAAKELADTVKEREENQFPAWLAQWEPWLRVLERIEPAEFQRAREAIGARVAQSNASPDVRRSPKQLHETDYRILNALTEEVLALRKQTSLLETPWRKGAIRWPSHLDSRYQHMTAPRKN